MTWIHLIPIIVKESNWKCSFWKLLVIFQIIVIIFLALAIGGVFDNLTDTANESGAVGEDDMDTLETNVVSEGSDDSYLTGNLAPNIIFLMADDIGWADI